MAAKPVQADARLGSDNHHHLTAWVPNKRTHLAGKLSAENQISDSQKAPFDVSLHAPSPILIRQNITFNFINRLPSPASHDPVFMTSSIWSAEHWICSIIHKEPDDYIKLLLAVWNVHGGRNAFDRAVRHSSSECTPVTLLTIKQ